MLREVDCILAESAEIRGLIRSNWISIIYSPKENGIINTVKDIDHEYDYESKLQQLQKLLQHHDTKSVLLVVSVHSAEERVQVLNMVPSCCNRRRQRYVIISIGCGVDHDTLYSDSLLAGVGVLRFKRFYTY